jgi:hypothetical protein
MQVAQVGGTGLESISAAVWIWAKLAYPHVSRIHCLHHVSLVGARPGVDSSGSLLRREALGVADEHVPL